MPITIKDVAFKAGVSTATVSRTFSHSDTVRPETRDKVIAAANTLGFNIPSSLNRSQRTYRIAILTGEPNVTWFDANCYKGVNDVLQPAGYDITWHAITSMRQREEFFRARPLQRNLDAIIIVSFAIDKNDIRMLQGMKLPVIGINVPTTTGFDATVRIDDRAGMRLIVDHLHRLGHRRIIYACNAVDEAEFDYSADTRMQGFLEACHAYDGLSASVLEVHRDGHLSAEALSRLMVPDRERPTALCCISDDTALAILVKARRSGLSIPRDLSLVGFDDIPFAASAGLTTVHQDPYALGQTAAHKALQLINGTIPEIPHETASTFLAIRDSVAPPHDARSQRKKSDS